MKRLGAEVSKEHKKGIGSTDVGNVSQVIPTIQPSIKICNSDVAGHSLKFAEAAKSSCGNEAVILGGKALAILGYELLTSPEKLNLIKSQFKNIRNQ